ncbi:hypothetical protein [Thermocoleostomius sinensis]|uniref:Uncharacterized protein n=1 Tax=Thermocoleostomius sinensis A174 TaxID=2016057 RepID=A0A9E8ZNA8_9CYAN|nr:hypothetical protein [Thermocoleostomius sinensis]WAL61676.1 hypothetical protein OXH18_06750 [Thermocoleostomius sinensis A174]
MLAWQDGELADRRQFPFVVLNGTSRPRHLSEEDAQYQVEQERQRADRDKQELERLRAQLQSQQSSF